MRAITVRNGLHFYGIEEADTFLLPFVGSVKAGFPSPAQDFMESDIDLVELLGMNKPSVYIVRADGESMVERFIPDGGFLVVDRSYKPQANDIVVAVVNGEFTIKRLVATASVTGWALYAANNFYDPIIIKEHDEFSVWGVVANIVIPLRGPFKIKSHG